MKKLILNFICLMSLNTYGQVQKNSLLLTSSFKNANNEFSYIKNTNNLSFLVGYRFDGLGGLLNSNEEIIYKLDILSRNKPDWYFENSSFCPTYSNSGYLTAGLYGNQIVKQGQDIKTCERSNGFLKTNQTILNFGVGKFISNKSQIFFIVGINREKINGRVEREKWYVVDNVYKCYDSWHIINPLNGYWFYSVDNEVFEVYDKRVEVYNNQMKYYPNFKVMYNLYINDGLFSLSYGTREGISFGYGLLFGKKV
jgi:hypothetical protein